MNDRENRKHQMFVRVRDFGAEHATDFAANSLGSRLFVTLSGIVTTLEGHATSQASKGGAARQGTTSRGQARQALLEDLQAISRTARVMADEVPGLDEKFRLPLPGNDALLLSTARAFAVDARPLAAQFIAHEIAADFLEDLADDIAAMEAGISEQSSGLGQRIAAGAAIDSVIDEGVAAVRKLDAIVKNKYANNPAVLAQWTSASHTERDPRSKRPPSAPTSGSPTGGSGTGATGSGGSGSGATGGGGSGSGGAGTGGTGTGGAGGGATGSGGSGTGGTGSGGSGTGATGTGGPSTGATGSGATGTGGST
ncbi:MAG TPA: hypothetical protein VGO73_04360 [Pyrinomonadaceae bacterium]|jgi:hypothetical protein|nr:hypothetical protein [Pyrinomonadaceae bacterium]